MFRFKRLQLILHILGWSILLCFSFIGRELIHPSFFIKSLLHIALLAGLFYFNMLFIIPAFFIKGKSGGYWLITILLLMLFLITNYLIDYWFMTLHSFEIPPPGRFKHHPPPWFRVFPSFLSGVCALGISTSVRIIDEYLKKEKQQKEIENEKLNSELTFLRYQINPHFLFNTLNNLYSLAHTGSNKTEEAILKLSELMRYMLEDNEAKKVLLVKEIEYIKNYLDLQRLRIHDSVIIEFKTHGLDVERKIEPLILIPFIENAFKHGVSYNQFSYIYIDIDIIGNKLLMRVENSLPKSPVEKDSTSGIGLVNVKKRLNLLYPDKHTLLINSESNKYTTTLEIEL